MSHRICTAARGIGSWRERLVDKDRQWKREFSAMETAVSWEHASLNRESGLPQPIERLFDVERFAAVKLLVAIAEHKVPLAGSGPDSQCDVWAMLYAQTLGLVSMSVEAKARENFGENSLADWLAAGKTDNAARNRQLRWESIAEHLPARDYSGVRYQMLHRCAAAVIEAKRWKADNAAFVVQAFHSPASSFKEYELFCQTLGCPAERNALTKIERPDNFSLYIGWADCPLATDRQIASCV